MQMENTLIENLCNGLCIIFSIEIGSYLQKGKTLFIYIKTFSLVVESKDPLGVSNSKSMIFAQPYPSHLRRLLYSTFY